MSTPRVPRSRRAYLGRGARRVEEQYERHDQAVANAHPKSEQRNMRRYIQATATGGPARAETRKAVKGVPRFAAAASRPEHVHDDRRRHHYEPNGTGKSPKSPETIEKQRGREARPRAPTRMGPSGNDDGCYPVPAQ